MQSQNKLPSYTLYRSHCHSSVKNIFAYLSSTKEVKVLNFDEENKIKNFVSITIPQEPIKSLQLFVVENQQQTKDVLVGVAFISKFIIFNFDGTPFYEGSLKLTMNIANFNEGFIGMKVYQENKAILSKRTGEVLIFDFFKKEHEELSGIKRNENNYYCSLATLNQTLYRGTETGTIQGINLSTMQVLQVCKSGSNFPILNLLADEKNQQIIASTAQGQILLISSELFKLSIVSAHHSNITRMYKGFGGYLFTFGEDSIMHKFILEKERKIQILHSHHNQKLASCVFTINEKNYVTFYEEPYMKQI